jgi:hypothetical protein
MVAFTPTPIHIAAAKPEKILKNRWRVNSQFLGIFA